MFRYAVLAVLIATSQLVYSHCQLPCGIYHDQMNIAVVDEAIQTIDRCVDEITHNQNSTPLERNQLVRWVVNKDQQADLIAERVSYYFLQQRIPLNADNLEKKLASAHTVLVLAMKVKQTVDERIVDSLRDEWENFKRLYLAKKSA